MTCNNKCIHYPVCEQKKFEFANIEERPHYQGNAIIIDSNKFWVPYTCLECPFLSSFNEVYVDKDNYNKIAYCTLHPDVEDPWRKISWLADNKEEWCPIKEVQNEQRSNKP